MKSPKGVSRVWFLLAVGVLALSANVLAQVGVVKTKYLANNSWSPDTRTHPRNRWSFQFWRMGTRYSGSRYRKYSRYAAGSGSKYSPSIPVAATASNQPPHKPEFLPQDKSVQMRYQGICRSKG
jgi:hypothetical protein